MLPGRDRDAASLAAHEALPAPDEQIHVRITVHSGVGLRDTVSIFGSIVNAAARMEALAGADQIVLSGAVSAHLGDELRTERTRQRIFGPVMWQNQPPMRRVEVVR